MSKRNRKPLVAPTVSRDLKSCPKWWERNDCKVRPINDGQGNFAVEAICTRLGVTYTLGTIAVVVTPPDSFADCIKTPSPEALANRIAADPGLLDTIDDPNVLDLRDRGTAAVPWSGVGVEHRIKACEEMVEKVGLNCGTDDHAILLPDGTVRDFILVSDPHGDFFMHILGAERKEKPEESEVQS